MSELGGRDSLSLASSPAAAPSCEGHRSVRAGGLTAGCLMAGSALHRSRQWGVSMSQLLVRAVSAAEGLVVGLL